MKSLTELANFHGTDKGTKVGNSHGYTIVYEEMLNRFRERQFSLVEVGLSIGGPEHGNSPDRVVHKVPSIEMWMDYFPQARITGIDVSDCSGFERERFNFVRVDCSDRAQLHRAAASIAPDIILDDGSHASYHQQGTFLEFFPRLASGGLYFIEDLDWQPEVYERSLPPTARTAALFDWLAANPRERWSTMVGYSDWRAVLSEIKEIRLFRASHLRALAKNEEEGRLFGFLWSSWRKRRIREDPIKLVVVTKV